MIVMKYTEVMNSNFAQTMEKISSTPVHGNVASQIHKVVKQVDQARKQIMKEFQDEVVEKFGKRGADGKITRPDGQPMGYDLMEDKEDEFEKTCEAFDTRTVELNCNPFTLSLFGDIKVSARDLEVLKGLYAGNAETEKPELPGKDNVASLR